MSIKTGTDHIADGLDKLLEQFKNQTNIAAIISAFGTQDNAVESALADLLNLRSIDTATGLSLDIIGALVGMPRDGHTDAIYRLWIKAQILMNIGGGDTPELYAILLDITQLAASKFQITDRYPAEMVVAILSPPTGVPNADIKSILELARPATVHTVLTIASDNNPLMFQALADSSTGKAFAVLAGTGGGTWNVTV